jgi:hypothetical protein
MSRAAIDVGSFSWARIQRLYDVDAVVHWQRCDAEGLQCPREVFTQVFHAEENVADTESADEMPSGPNLLSLDSLRGVDWGRVTWELTEMSGIALRHIRVDREFQHALDDARDQATQFGIVDEREEVVTHWKEAKSWVVPPVVVSGDLLGGGAGFQLLVGYTRLGNLLGMLDRQEVTEIQKHLVWVGRGTHN